MLKMVPQNLTDSDVIALKLKKGGKHEEAQVIRIEKNAVKASIDKTPMRNTPFTRYSWFKKLP